MFTRRLLKWDTQTLRAHARGLCVLRLIAVTAAFTPLLDLILAILTITYTLVSVRISRVKKKRELPTVRNQDDVLRVQGRHKVSPVSDDLRVLVICLLRLLVQVGLDGVQEGLQALRQALKWDWCLYARVAAYAQYLFLFNIFRSILDAHGHSLQFPVVEFVSWAVGFTGISFHADTGLLKGVGDLLDARQQRFPFGLGGARGEAAGNDDDLVGRDTGREDEPFVVAMDHDHDTNDAGRQAPRVLPDE